MKPIKVNDISNGTNETKDFFNLTQAWRFTQSSLVSCFVLNSNPRLDSKEVGVRVERLFDLNYTEAYQRYQISF